MIAVLRVSSAEVTFKVDSYCALVQFIGEVPRFLETSLDAADISLV